MLRSQALETPQLGFREEASEPGQVQPGSGEPGRLWCRATSGSTGFRRRFRWRSGRFQGFLEPPPELSLQPCWTWLGFAPRLPGTFSGTFSGTLLNLTWLCTKAFRPSPEPRWPWPGACTSAHRRAEDPISLRLTLLGKHPGNLSFTVFHGTGLSFGRLDELLVEKMSQDHASVKQKSRRELRKGEQF